MYKFDYNLVLMHVPGFQSIGDFLTVRNMMIGIAPEIRIHILGQDIVRDVDTQALYVMELNSGGWTWHLSSDFGNRFRMQFKLDYYGQFNALEKITSALARFTIAHAS